VSSSFVSSAGEKEPSRKGPVAHRDVMLKGLVRVLFQGKNLLWTNLGISVGLSGFGDVITQAIEGKNSHSYQ